MRADSSVNQFVDAFQRIDEKAHWVRCPACHEEWTKLRPCEYFQEGRTLVSSVCVECAESPKSFDWFNSQYPVPGLQIFIHPIHAFRHQAEITARMYEAEVKYQGIRFLVRSDDSTGVRVFDGGPEPVRYDNTYQAWFAIKTKLEKGTETGEEMTGWEKVRKNRK